MDRACGECNWFRTSDCPATIQRYHQDSTCCDFVSRSEALTAELKEANNRLAVAERERDVARRAMEIYCAEDWPDPDLWDEIRCMFELDIIETSVFDWDVTVLSFCYAIAEAEQVGADAQG